MGTSRLVNNILDAFYIVALGGFIFLAFCSLYVPERLAAACIIALPTIMVPFYGFVDTSCDLASNIYDLTGQNTSILRPLPRLLSFLHIAPADASGAFLLIIVLFVISQSILSLSLFQLLGLFLSQKGSQNRGQLIFTSAFVFTITFFYSPLLGSPSLHLFYQFVGFSFFSLALSLFATGRRKFSVLFFILSIFLHPMTGLLNTLVLSICFFLLANFSIRPSLISLSIFVALVLSRIDILLDLLSFLIPAKARLLVDAFISNDRPLLSSLTYLSIYALCSVILWARFKRLNLSKGSMVCPLYYLCFSSMALPLVLFTNQQILTRILFAPLVIPGFLPLLTLASLRLPSKNIVILLIFIALAWNLSARVPTGSSPNYGELGYACYLQDRSNFR